jgi:glucan biosynthesis protein C
VTVHSVLRIAEASTPSAFPVGTEWTTPESSQLAGCFVAYNLLIFVPRSQSLTGVLSASGMGALESILWVVSCVASCFGFVALFRGVVRTRRPWMDSVARSAYTIYLVHYVFVLWAQYALLDEPVPASIKFATTFAFALLFSWMTAQALLWIPGARRVS